MVDGMYSQTLEAILAVRGFVHTLAKQWRKMAVAALGGRMGETHGLDPCYPCAQPCVPYLVNGATLSSPWDSPWVQTYGKKGAVINAAKFSDWFGAPWV